MKMLMIRVFACFFLVEEAPSDVVDKVGIECGVVNEEERDGDEELDDEPNDEEVPAS